MKLARICFDQNERFREQSLRLVELLGRTGLSIEISSEPSEGFQNIFSPSFRESEVPGPRTLALRTSGTTGAPKTVVKDFEELWRTKKGKGLPEHKWLLTYSPARWAGLSVILHCLKTGASLVIPMNLEPEGLISSLPEVTHLSLTPSLLRKLVLGGLQAQPQVQQVTFGGEYAQQSSLDLARLIFPNARISHLYASTELGDIACESDGREGFSHLPGEICGDGELKINGFSTGDLWKVENGRYYFLGRAQEVINVGGAKVSPIEIESLILQMAGVRMAKVYGVASPILGQMVCADIVGDIELREVHEKLLARLPKYAVPRLKKVSSIELTSAGKVKR